MKQKLIFCLLVLLFVGNAGNVRFLQTYDDPNCAQWNFDGTQCLACAPRTYNNTELGKCIQVNDNCKTWNETDGNCLTCYDGYGTAARNGEAIDGNCPFFNEPNINFTDINCQCFTDNRTCLFCFAGYALNDQGICQPFNGTDCRVFDNEICIQCNAGYYLDTMNMCLQLPANCTKADTQGLCTECIQGLVLVNGTCTQILVEMSPNCEIPMRGGRCSKCYSGYFLNPENRCRKIRIRGCEQADINGMCTLCKVGYYLNNYGECQKLPEFCSQADEKGICVSCESGYYLNAEKMCAEMPQNCVQASEDGKCTSCTQKYFISKGICKAEGQKGTVNLDCAEQNQSGECISCRQFYKLENGNCIPTGENPYCMPGACECGTGDCLQCMGGYFLDNNGICIQISQNCKKYSYTTGKCLICFQGCDLIEGQCIPNKGSLINQTNLNCKEQDEMGNCISCRKYYEFNNGTCIPIGQNPKCRIFNEYNQCICCYYPHEYYLDYNHICVPKNTNCLQFDEQTGQCTQCYAEDQLEDGECIESLIQQKKIKKGK